MIERIPLCGSRAPYGDHPTPMILTENYIKNVIDLHLNGRIYVSHTVEHEEFRDGTVIHNGLEVPASKLEYYIVLNTKAKGKDVKDVPKAPVEPV
jgi:hypothetical protein